MYHDGQRALQDWAGSQALADRLEERLQHRSFTEADKAFVEASPFFFLATADTDGRPDCSFKGGAPGFARVVAPDLLVWPDYDGNGMFRSLGNIRANPHVGLLFLRIGEKAARLRVNGRAEVVFDDPLMAAMPGAQLLVKLTPEAIFPNCPRYVPHLELVEPSVYVPAPDAEPVEPAWKGFDAFKDVVPPRRG
ncbi:MAG TPA: pyridoxamine 5'-phosphate oxidase family protein [Caulobacteraceae bacterium]|nr:pyridoxamine 5'-phosphate oxidase family protein [Caulobacteraceae bacterium]